MQKEKTEQMTSKIQEVKEMTSQNIPYSNQALLKWSALKVVRSEDKQRPYKLVKTSLVELVKSAEYSQFRDRFNWLYRNYNPENYQLVWNELQEFNARRIQKCFQDNAIEIANAKMQKTIDNVVAHFGEMPAWIKNLHKGFELHFNYGLKSDINPYSDTGLYFTDNMLDTKQAFSMIKTFVKSKGVNLPDRKIWRRTKIVDVRQQTKAKRELLLDRAKTCYGLHPEYELCTVETKQVYSIPERYIKEYTTVVEENKAFQIETPSGKYTKKVLRNNEIVEVKYNTIVLDKITEPIYYSNEELYKSRIVPSQYQTLVGKVQVVVEMLRKTAEDAVIRDARWMSQFNDTDLDMRELREVEDTNEHNKMVPVTDLQGPDTPYGLDVEFRDFLEPVYEDSEGL